MEWISVKDSLPNEDVLCVVTDGEKVYFAYIHSFPRRDCWISGGTMLNNIIYWIALPEFPLDMLCHH